MGIFLTGGTGFIGRHLIEVLRRRQCGAIYVLVRPASRDKFSAMLSNWNIDESAVTPVFGDVGEPLCGLGDEDRNRCAGQVSQFFHLAGSSNPAETDEAVLQCTDVVGTQNALSLAKALGAACFHHVSSWGVSGDFDGIWTEEMFEEYCEGALPQFRSKREAEAIVRREAKIPVRIYRPGIVLGRSDTGEFDTPQGVAKLFPTLDHLASKFPSWLPLPILGCGQLNVVPVDFVASALDYLAHKEGLDGRCFHLMNPENEGFSDLLNVFSGCCQGPQFRLPLGRRVFDLIPEKVAQHVFRLMPKWDLLLQTAVDAAGVPPVLLGLEDHPTIFESRETHRLLGEVGLHCPPLEAYANRVWNFWKQHFAPALKQPGSVEEVVRGRTVMVTGASSGIGLEVAKQFARAGARVLLVARSVDKLEALQAEIEAEGGVAFVCPADLSEGDACDALIAQVLEEHGGVDVLVNNAGRSISRLLVHSLDRIHDFERTMALNYFGPVRLTLGLIPHMCEKGYGHFINVLSAGAQGVGPGFSAYCASKSAMDAFGHVARGELADDGIFVTNIYMGLVYTPMSAPSPYFEEMNGLHPDEAADLVCQSVVHRKEVVSVEPTGALNRFLWAVWPKAAHVILLASCRGYKQMVKQGLALRMSAADGQ